MNEQFDSTLYYFNKIFAIPTFENGEILQISVMQNIGLIVRYTGEPKKPGYMSTVYTQFSNLSFG